MLKTLSNHWPEYLMEAWGVAVVVIAACIGTSILWHPGSPIQAALIDHPMMQRLLMGLLMGLTLLAVVYSPYGKRSGAHFNPALTFTFFRLGKIAPWDALFYVTFQFLGAVAGVSLVSLIAFNWLSVPEVSFAITIPGEAGVSMAFIAELVISAIVMGTVLILSNTRKFMRVTGIAVALLIVAFLTFEAPLSGMSMNPARTVGSALGANIWTALWIYFVAPTLGMLIAAEIFLWTRGQDAVRCAKLNHTADVRCIFK